MKTEMSPFTKNRTVTLDDAELQMMAEHMPVAIANRVADKFVEEIWPKLKSDEEFMAAVKKGAAAESTKVIAELISARVANALGVEDGTQKEA